MSFSPVSFLLRLTSLTLMWKGFRYGDTVFSRIEWIVNSKCGLFQFLTIQSLLASMLTMALSQLADVTSSRQVRKLQRLLLAIILPVAWVVTIIYWSLLIFLPHLIFPDYDVEIDTSINVGPDPEFLPRTTRLPISHDMLLHVVPAASLTIEFMFFQKPYSKHVLAFGAVVPISHVIAATYYGMFVEYCASETGEFPYPFLTVMPFYIRVLIYAGITLFATCALRFLNGLHSSKQE